MKTIQPYILIVEDSRIASVIASSILTNLDCLVDTAETGEKALELVGQNQYDLIFMDLGLPNTTGMAVTEKIRQMEGKKTIPIVALTAHDTEEARDECFKAGMVGFIVKPLDVPKARNFLEEYVGK